MQTYDLTVAHFVHTISCMEYEWDEDKRRKNLQTHGIDFVAILGFHWETAIEAIDSRFDYSEERINAVGFLGERLVVLTYTERQNVIRVISLRKTTKTEEKFYHDHS